MTYYQTNYNYLYNDKNSILNSYSNSHSFNSISIKKINPKNKKQILKNQSFVSPDATNMSLSYKYLPNNISKTQSHSLTPLRDTRNDFSLRFKTLEHRLNNLEQSTFQIKKSINVSEIDKISTNNNTIIQSKIDKIDLLEREIISLKEQNNNNNKIISELRNKITFLEENICKSGNISDVSYIINSLSDKEKKLNLLAKDLSDLIMRNEQIVNNVIEEKFSGFNIKNENRINELLTLIQDINKIVDQNENNMGNINLNIEKMYKDNAEIIKVVSIQDQKIKEIDFIEKEINNLKSKYTELMNDFYDNLNTKNSCLLEERNRNNSALINNNK